MPARRSDSLADRASEINKLTNKQRDEQVVLTPQETISFSGSSRTVEFSETAEDEEMCSQFPFQVILEAAWNRLA